jgi:SAM-dependent methyltransferase
MKIERCRACQSRRVVQFLDLGNQPFANALLDPDFREEKQYPLSLSYCKDCSLVQLDYTAAPEELFSNYFWVTSTSSTAREYAKQFYEGVKTYIKEDRRYVLEIASNDGTFLKEFKEHGYEVLGVDPAKNIAKQANEQGIATRVDFFQKTVAEDIVKEKGYPSVIYARNVLPHVADLSGFVEGLACCCGDDNLLVIEVHYSGKILDELHYDSIYHEHLHYFTLTSVINLLKHYGLFVFDVSLSPISGGSVVLYVSKREKERSPFLKKMLAEEEARGYNTLEKWNEFAKTVAKHKEELLAIIRSGLEEGKRIIAYGASARSSTMLNYCKIGKEMIAAVIDQNSLKQGHLTPGSHMLIGSAEKLLEEKPDVILLLAWNFKDEIMDILRNQYGYAGEVIIPLPYPPHTESLEVAADGI